MGTQQLIGHRLVDKDGAAVGKIGQVFYDDQTDVAKWITVRTGLFGSRENLVPLVGAEMVYDALQVPWSKSKIKSAPSFDVDQHISVEQEDSVYAHYGLNPEIPGQRIPEQFARPRGKHARPEPQERPAAPQGPAARSPEPESEQRIWEPNRAGPRPEEADSGGVWESNRQPPQPHPGGEGRR
ncbi:PRC-barrel domain containing protein [Streptomonospora sp. PA3]|nr:PRC-barrel domain-containing protein [Streptomonospora sp. PA3]MUL41900.1 PRC-barrel domain containing protein [Streptomonospora sp. PA3]